MTLSFIILATIRMTLIHYVFFLFLRRRVNINWLVRLMAIVIALLICAVLDSVTRDGVDVETALGHPFYFYVVANIPIAAGIFAIAVIFFNSGSPDEPSRLF